MTTDPESLLLRAERLLESRELEAAWEVYGAAESAGASPASCSGGRWFVAMLRGDFEAAWCESDRIRELGDDDPHRFWRGEDFSGKRVIVRCLHGFGDTVQLIRYIPLIAESASTVILEVAPALVELARWFKGVDEVITWGEQAPGIPPAWDVQMEINELPYILRTSEAELPLAERYIELPSGFRPSVNAEVPAASRLRVGVVWASGEWNPSRSIPTDVLRPLFESAGVEFWNLQGGASRTEWEQFPSGPRMHEAKECAESLVQLAGLIAQLDLVITPDTLAAHLAGALGTPAWVMLEHAADWRWQHARSDSPWYPSLRLFRQPRAGDWRAVVEAVTRELQELVEGHAQERLVA